MKRKIIIFISIVVLLMSVFALTVGAQQINKDTKVTLSGSFTDANGNTVTEVNLFDEDGDALIWYLDANQKLVSAKSADLITVSEDGVASFKDTSIFYGKSTITSIVVVNLRSNVKNATVNYDGQIKHFGKESDNEFANKDVNCTTGFQFGGYSVRDAQIQAFYVPTSAKSLYKRMFQNTPVRIVDIEPNTPIDVIGVHCFNSASKLEQIFIPKGVKTFLFEEGAGMFTSCSSLQAITFEEGSQLENAGCFTFRNCGSLTKLYLPNSVKTFGHRFIQSCHSLKEFSFGASFEYFDYHSEFGANNQDMWIMHNASSLEKVYLPATLDLTTYSSIGWRQIFDSANNSFTLYFTGTEAQLDAIIAKLSEAGTNGNIVNIKTQNRVQYVTVCNAFYNGQHNDAVTYGFDGEDKYTSSFCKFDGCTRCTNKTITKYGTLFTNKGYSKEQDGTYFVYGIVFNKDVIALYLEKTEGATFSYGLLAAKYTQGASTGVLFDENGAPVDDCVAIDATKAAYSVYSLKITDLDKVDNSKSQSLYCCAYIVDNGAIKYVANKVTETATTICYNDIEVVIDTTTPPTTGDDQNA